MIRIMYFHGFVIFVTKRRCCISPICPQIVKCFAIWLDESMDLSDECVVGMNGVYKE